MSSNTKTYILLVAVICIWAIIGFKMINGFGSNPVIVNTNEHESFFTPKPIDVKENFTIDNVDRDPFLGTLFIEKKPNPKIKLKSKKIKLPDPKLQISYLGLIKEQVASTKTSSSILEHVFVVNINSQQFLLKKGQIVNKVTLVRGNENEIVIRYNKTLQTIKRK